jgi:hypothetical protein
MKANSNVTVKSRTASQKWCCDGGYFKYVGGLFRFGRFETNRLQNRPRLKQHHCTYKINCHAKSVGCE